VRDDDDRDAGLALRCAPSAMDDDDPVNSARVLLSLSKEDIFFRSESLCGGEDDIGSFGAVDGLLPTKLKCLNRAKVLRFEVSDLALSVGEGGDRSGRG
jgi:hypothetical protein